MSTNTVLAPTVPVPGTLSFRNRRPERTPHSADSNSPNAKKTKDIREKTMSNPAVARVPPVEIVNPTKAPRKRAPPKPPVVVSGTERRKQATVARGSSNSDREPWSSLLSSNRSKDKVSSFGNFDPLRTLHFLVHELQSQIGNVLPDNNNIQQMLADMNVALKRIPPEVSSALQLQQVADIKMNESERYLKNHTLSDEPSQVEVNEKMCQTPPTLSEEDTEIIKKIVERNTLKLETSCKEMEQLCTILKKEKNWLEEQVKHEQETVRLLRMQLKESEAKIDDLINGQLNRIQESVKLSSGETTPQNAPQLDLVRLKSQKVKVEYDYNKLKGQLAILEMEKEKYASLLHLRSKEMTDIYKEMSRYREESYATLAQLQGEFMNFTDENKENAGDATISSLSSSYDPNSFREMPAGDGAAARDEHLQQSQDNGEGSNPPVVPKSDGRSVSARSNTNIPQTLFILLWRKIFWFNNRVCN